MSEEQKGISQQEDAVYSQDGSISEQQIINRISTEHHMVIEKEDNDNKCATYVFRNEDHTLGNVLRTVLSGHSDVEFVGYSIPHPSENKMNLRLQTMNHDTDLVLNQAIKTVQAITKTMRQNFKCSLNQYKSGKL